MKTITVKYNEYGKITDVSDNSLYFEQENESLCICAEITTGKSVRAYIKASNNNSYVTETLTKSDTGVYSFTVADTYMSKGTMYVGFEVFDQNGYIERFEPFKVYIDSFVSLGSGSGSNVYVVTVNVGDVETLEPGEDAYVVNAGNQKDMKLNFGIPKGAKGDKGDAGYTPQKGVDYYTNADKQELIGAIEDYVDGELDGKVDKVTGKGLSTNDLTDELKKKIQENTFDGYFYFEAGSSSDEGGELSEDIPGTLFNNITTDGMYKTKIVERFGDYNTHFGILICMAETVGTIHQIYISTDGIYSRMYESAPPDYETMEWSEWVSINKGVLDYINNNCELLKNKGSANGYAPLDSSALVPVRHINKAVPHTTESGYPISVTDHLEGEDVIDYKVYGNSMQDGTPSTDNPVEIESVGDLVTDETSEYYGKYDVPVTICGKNLFDGVWKVVVISATGSISYGGSAKQRGFVIDAKANTSYTVYTSSVTPNFRAVTLDSGGNVLNFVNAANKQILNISTSENCAKLAVYIGLIEDVTNITLMLAEGNYTAATMPEYEPYQAETKHIYLDEPLRKVGSYADYIDFENQKAIRLINVLDSTGTKTIEESFGLLSVQTEENITVPGFTMPDLEVMNVSAGTATPPSGIDLTYYQDINKVIAELKNAVLAQGGEI